MPFKNLSKWVFIFSLAHCTIVQMASRNNSNPVEALKDKLFSTPLVLQNSFLPRQKKDYYAIKVDREGFYTISVSAVKGADISLSLLNDDVQILSMADNGYQNQGETLPAVYLKAKIYYLCVAHKKDIPPIFRNNQSWKYTLLVQRFFPRNMRLTSQWDYGHIPRLETLQVISPNIPLYGFFTPNNGTLLSPSLKNFVSHMETLGHITKDRPYHLSLYTFLSPNHPEKIRITLSGVRGVNSLLALCKISDFLSLSHLQDLSQNNASTSSLAVASERGSGEGEILNEISLVPNERYILAVLGFNSSAPPSFLEMEKNFYQLSINTKKDLR